jgi:hypothetical protein
VLRGPLDWRRLLVRMCESSQEVIATLHFNLHAALEGVCIFALPSAFFVGLLYVVERKR